MSDLMQWYLVCYSFQISHSYIQYYGSNVPFNNFGVRRVPVPVADSFKNRWTYQSNGQCETLPAQYSYGNYYYPYKSFKYSYIKYAPNPFKRESPNLYPEWDRFRYAINPSERASKKLEDNTHNYNNYLPRDNWPSNYLSNYYQYYQKTNAYYPSSQVNKNYSCIYPRVSPMLPDVYHRAQRYPPSPVFIPRIQTFDYWNQSSSESPTTNRIKKQTGFDFNAVSKNLKNKKLLFMFPSEIVIKSLGPWAQVGNKGEFSSNGTFSIRYDVSSAESMNISNEYQKQFQDVKTVIESSTKYEYHRSELDSSTDIAGSVDTSDHLYDKVHDGYKEKKKRQMDNFVRFFRPGRKPKSLTHKHRRKNEKKGNTSPTRRSHKVRHHVKGTGKTNGDISNARKTKYVIGKVMQKKCKNNTSKGRALISSIFDDSIDCSQKESTTTEEECPTTIEECPTTTEECPTTTEECPTTTEECPTTEEATTHGTISTTQSELTETTTFTKSSATFTYLLSTTSLSQLVGGAESLKTKCERENGVKCVCSIRTLITDLDKIATETTESKELLRDLANSNCSKYSPLQHSYKISSSLKPKLISNKPKELIVDDDTGPKKLEGETLEELIDRGIPNEGIDFYVFPSTNIEVPCITTNDIQLSPNTADSTTYTWTHGNNNAITEGRIIEDINHRGSLVIQGVTLEDSDNYTCRVHYTSPDTELQTGSTFIHSILVVSEPILALHTLIHYKAKTVCNQEILEMFELYLPTQIEHSICENDEKSKICNVEIYNPICRTNTGRGNSKTVVKRLSYEIPSAEARERRDTDVTSDETMEMSMNYQIDTGDIWRFMPSTDNKSRCSPFCEQKIQLKLMEALQDSIYDALSTPVESSTGIVFEPDTSTIKVKLVIACRGGLRLSQGFCVPCPKDHYSEEGRTQCTKCPPGTYQDSIGSKSCKDCPHPFKEGCVEMWFTPIMIIILIAGIIIAILLCCLLFCFCRYWPVKQLLYATRTYHHLKPTTTNHSNKKVKIKKQKKQKQGKYREPPQLPSEDFSV